MNQTDQTASEPIALSTGQSSPQPAPRPADRQNHTQGQAQSHTQGHTQDHAKARTSDHPWGVPRVTPWWDSSLPHNERVDWLIANMSIDEKLGFLATITPDLLRFGIARCCIGSEAAHGIEARRDQGSHPADSEITTSLPQPIGMSATWDPALLERAGEAVGVEARVLYHRHPEGGLFRWAPTVDLERDSRWGRNEEGYGEDPLLTGEMAGAYVRGMQGGDPSQTREHLRISAALKHFFANNVEDGRCVTSSTVDARNRREYYYEPFRRCIEQSGATSVMTSYNAVNGTVEMHDPRVEELLHGEYGLYGHVVSDGGAVSLVHDARHDTNSHAETVALSLKAGVDCMTDDMDLVHEAAGEAWERGLIDERDVDRALRRSLTTKLRLGMYDAVPANPFDAVSEADIDSPEHRAVALQVAEESVVLLKNDGGLLPLDMRDAGACDANVCDANVCGTNARDGRDADDNGNEPTEAVTESDASEQIVAGCGGIVVIGPLGDQWFQDWYGGEPPFRCTLLDGVRRVVPGSAEASVDASARETVDQAANGLTAAGAHGVSGGMLDEASVRFDDALDVVLMRFGGRYAALHDDGALVAVDDRDSAERFRLQDWGDGALTLRAQSTGLYLTAEDDGAIQACKRIPFGWFVKEVFRIGDDERLCTWNDVPLHVAANGRIRALAETDLSAQRIGVPQTSAIATVDAGSAEGGDTVSDGGAASVGGVASGGNAVSSEGAASGEGVVSADAASGGRGTSEESASDGPSGSGEHSVHTPVFAFETVECGLERAATLAKRVGTVIAAVGCCPMINGKEDADRPSTAFPPAQRALMQTLVEANHRTVMALISNYPYDIDWEQAHVPAIVQSASGGQSMGDALARVLFGLASPAGRLPMTWYGADVPLPDKNDYDIIATKRTYQWHDGDVLYPFGHGLTYAPFRYDDPTVHTVSANDAIHASVRITNVGTVPSDEVVQLYIRHPQEADPVLGSAHRPAFKPIPKPIRRLVAFRREHDVRPGESRTIEFDVPREELRIFDVRKGDFRVPDGEYVVEAGASSGDIRVKAVAMVRGERPAIRPVDQWIPVDHWDAAENVSLTAAEPLPGQRRSEACVAVAAASAAATASEDDAVARAHYTGFEPFGSDQRLELAGNGIELVRVIADAADDVADDVADNVSDDGAPTVPDPADGTFPLPRGANGFTVVIPRHASVRGFRVIQRSSARGADER